MKWTVLVSSWVFRSGVEGRQEQGVPRGKQDKASLQPEIVNIFGNSMYNVNVKGLYSYVCFWDHHSVKWRRFLIRPAPEDWATMNILCAHTHTTESHYIWGAFVKNVKSHAVTESGSLCCVSACLQKGLLFPELSLHKQLRPAVLRKQHGSLQIHTRARTHTHRALRSSLQRRSILNVW